MNSENKLIIHSNENDKEINHYGKLLLAYKDYQLMEAIKLLPDDMIKEIKKYVMNPYKFMPELKLYKFPKFKIININYGIDYITNLNLIRLTINTDEERERIDNNLAVDFEVYEHKFDNGKTLLSIQGLQGRKTKSSKWDKAMYSQFGLENKTTIFNQNRILKQLHKINTKKKNKIQKVLKDNNVKGRTKLLKECSNNNYAGRSEIIRALMKI